MKPKITKRQKEIIYLLFKYRFLTTSQIYKFLEHKSPKRTQAWMKSLFDKGYVRKFSYLQSVISPNKPTVFYLSTLSLSILRAREDTAEFELEKVYKEKTRSEKFIQHSLFIADIALYLHAKKEEGKEITVFTKSVSPRVDEFPEKFWDLFVKIKTSTYTARYFLTFFDDLTPGFVYIYKLRQYIDFADVGSWEAVEEVPFPVVLLVVPTTRKQKTLYPKLKEQIEDYYGPKVDFYITSLEKIFSPELAKAKENIWQSL